MKRTGSFLSRPRRAGLWLSDRVALIGYCCALPRAEMALGS
jgi:hypothetical protein